MAECCKAPHDPLHPLYVLNWAHPCDGRALLRVVFDAMLGDDECKQHTPRDPENTFLRVEFDAIRLEFCETFLEVGHELVGLFGLDYDVVHISLNDFTDEVSKTLEHTSLVCSPYVLRTERHHDIVEQSKWGDKRGHKLVGLFHRDLMVPGVHIKEAEGFAP
jgi:hypothetical protein